MSIVLLADDDPFLIKIYSNKLTQDGHEVYTATNGQEALELAREHKPDLVVLDIMIPRINGLDVLSDLRSNSTTKKAKVVFLSNLSQEEELEEAKSRGAEEYLVKASYTPSQIIEKLQAYLDKPAPKSTKVAEDDKPAQGEVAEVSEVETEKRENDST